MPPTLAATSASAPTGATPTRTWNTASSPHTEQIAVSLSTRSASAISDGSGSNGRPSKVTSSPATMTTMPRAASRSATGTSPGPKNCASSMATTSVPSGTAGSMSSGVAAARAGKSTPACEASRPVPWRVSSAWLSTTTRRPAITDRRTRRTSSSVLPANIGPHTTSIRPIGAARSTSLMRTGSHFARGPRRRPAVEDVGPAAGCYRGVHANRANRA